MHRLLLELRCPEARKTCLLGCRAFPAQAHRIAVPAPVSRAHLGMFECFLRTGQATVNSEDLEHLANLGEWLGCPELVLASREADPLRRSLHRSSTMTSVRCSSCAQVDSPDQPEASLPAADAAADACIELDSSSGHEDAEAQESSDEDALPDPQLRLSGPAFTQVRRTGRDAAPPQADLRSLSQRQPPGGCREDFSRDGDVLASPDARASALEETVLPKDGLTPPPLQTPHHHGHAAMRAVLRADPGLLLRVQLLQVIPLDELAAKMQSCGLRVTLRELQDFCDEHVITWSAPRQRRNDKPRRKRPRAARAAD
jgi:hypothetical protein